MLYLRKSVLRCLFSMFLNSKFCAEAFLMRFSLTTISLSPFSINIAFCGLAEDGVAVTLLSLNTIPAVLLAYKTGVEGSKSISYKCTHSYVRICGIDNGCRMAEG